MLIPKTNKLHTKRSRPNRGTTSKRKAKRCMRKTKKCTEQKVEMSRRAPGPNYHGLGGLYGLNCAILRISLSVYNA